MPASDRHRPAPVRRATRIARAAVLAALAAVVGGVLAVGPVLASVQPEPAGSFTLEGLGLGALRARPSAVGPSRPDATPAPAGIPLRPPAPAAAPQPAGESAPVAAAASASPSPTASPTPQPTPTWSTAITTVGSTIRFYGRGYGHGVGMSQWGARGRALAGQTASTILGAYFTGTKPGTTSSTQPVRVSVLYHLTITAAAPLRLHGRSGPWTIKYVAATFPADAGLTAWPTSATVSGVTTTTWHLVVMAADGKTVLYRGSTTGTQAIVEPASAATRLELDSKGSAYDLYRGSIRFQLGATFANAINTVPLDDYLKGVVPVEMPATWPVEALRAQAVVARSWTVRHLHPTTGSFDVWDDSRSQVYRGVLGENAAVSTLIAAAPGAVQLYGSTVVNAFYHSAAGSWTENNEYAFVPSSGTVGSTPLAYLRGVDDRAPDGTPYDAAYPSISWSTVSLTHAQLNAILAADARTAVGTVTRLDLTHRGVSGRLYQVVVYGTTGTKTVSGDVFRDVYNAHRPAGTAIIRSNIFSASPLP